MLKPQAWIRQMQELLAAVPAGWELRCEGSRLFAAPPDLVARFDTGAAYPDLSVRERERLVLLGDVVVGSGGV